MDDIYFCFFENLKRGHEPLFFWLACQVFRTQTWEVLKERVSELSLTEAPWLYGLSQWMALAKLHIKFALLHFNLCHISWNLNLNHNILPERGGRVTDYASFFIHILYTAQTFERVTWDFLNWIQTPGIVGTGPAPLGPSTSRQKRSPISLLAAGWALCFWVKQRFKKIINTRQKPVSYSFQQLRSILLPHTKGQCCKFKWQIL